MHRRDFLRTAALGSAAASFPAPFLLAQPGPDLPNVLTVILEDIPDWFGCLSGHPDARTPNMDAFADRGVLFSNAHCSAPACNPSRASMFTSVKPSTSGAYTNDDDWRPLLADATTLPVYLRNNGYTTSRSGKFFQPFFEQDEAWDIAWSTSRPSTLSGRDPYAPYHPYNGLPYRMQSRFNFNWGATDEPMHRMADVRRANHLIDLIQGPEMPQPWFAAFGPTKVHFPAIVPRKYLERYNPETITLPPSDPSDISDLPRAAFGFIDEELHYNTLNYKQFRMAIVSYLAAIEYLDEQVGRVLDAWYSSPYGQDSIVVILADHGFHLGEKYHWRKWTLWDEGTRVFLGIDAPGIATPGGRCSAPVSLLDLYPTLTELLALPSLDQFEGTSLVPQLLAPSTPRDHPALITEGAGNHAVVDDRYRYIRYAGGDEELYDHAIDPEEIDNLATNPLYRPVMDALGAWMPDDG